MSDEKNDAMKHDLELSSQPFEPGSAMKKRKTTQGSQNDTRSTPTFEEELMLLQDSMDVDAKGIYEIGLPHILNCRIVENTESVWSRSPAPRLDPAKDKLVFQQIEIDDYMDYNEKKPIVRFYGITENGNSVVCHVHGFLPYFYFPAPVGLQRSHLPALKSSLSSAVGAINIVHDVDIVLKQSIYGYHGDTKSPFVKVSVNDPKDIFKVRNTLEVGVSVPGLDVPCRSPTTFESNLAFLLRFMIDCKVTGSNWIELPPGTYAFATNPISTAQIEVRTKFDSFISHAPEGEWSKMAPLRVLSFDIECAGRKGVFPEPEHDPVIQIASVVKVQGESKPFIRNIFTLNSCAQIVGSHVLSFYDERELLQKWRDFVAEVDPDVVIGYNTSNFDFPYLLDRARHLGVAKFPFFGRIKGRRTEVKDTKFSSKAYGTRENKSINMEGRLQLDMLQAVQRDYKLRSYTLNSVCAHFLGEQKEDVHHSIITELQNGNSETRRRLAVYCLKDAFLPLRLMDKLMLLFNYTEMARVTGVPFNYILVRGQQVKVISQLFRRALEQDLVIPVIKSEMTEEAYEGATVIEPEKGYYDVPIATLDFTSLYPSIMQAHNLCYTTLLSPQIVQQHGLVKDVDYVVTPNNDMFVTATKRKGLLPEILSDLLAARKRAKTDLKKETDPFKRAVLDGRQLALKTVEEHFTTKNGYKHNAQVIYGDTDSVMIKFGVDNLKEAMDLGREGAKIVTAKFIKPINLDFEKVYFPYLLISKKRYAGLYWTNHEKSDKLDAKGIETVRRDNCRMVSNVISTCLNKLLIDRDVAGAQEFVKQTIADLLQNKVDLSQLVITKALSKSDYAAKQAHVELAERMRRRDAGSAPALGDRVAYVITKASSNTPAYERSEDPLYVLENNIPIDTKYYLENQLSKPLLRIFEPILGNKADLLLSGAHTRTVNIATPTIGGLMKFAVKSATCLGCKSPLPKGAGLRQGFGNQIFSTLDTMSAVSGITTPGCNLYE
ncbi:DNA-directed DNA polymerase delta [Apophysomyces sp. BC1015]|nr:DNA-directed DNA polymerase delta [Apophysomyces sp. BC1015]